MIAIPIGDRRSIEIFGGPYVGAINDDLVGGIRASYGFQFTRRLDRGLGPDVEVFISSGAEGLVLRDQAYDCYGPGCGPHDRTYVLPPIIGMFGVGVQKAFSPHCALRIEAHGLFALVVPLGVRAGVSLSIPLGQVYRTSSKAARR
jgi:hypothetical protein